MTIENLIGEKLYLVVSEPWDFVTIHGSGPFEAGTIAVGSNYGAKKYKGIEEPAILIWFESPLTFEGEIYKYFISSPRLKTDKFESLLRGGSVLCSLTAIPENRATSKDPFDLGWWRGGGLGLIGTLKLASSTAQHR